MRRGPRRQPAQPPSKHPSGATPPVIQAELVPRHVAIVMDGNGRWAKQRGLPRTAGHQAGEHALFDGHAELAHPQIEELVVGPVGPLLWRQHRRFGHPCSVYATGTPAP